MKKVLCVLLCLAFCGILFTGCGSSSPADNSTSAEQKATTDEGSDSTLNLKKNSDGLFEIYSAEDLAAYRDYANDVMNTNYNEDHSNPDCNDGFILMDDIDLSEYKDWEPIGYNALEYQGEHDHGYISDTTIDGNNYSISGLSVSKDGLGPLIAYLFDVDVKNLTFKNCSITTDSDTALLAMKAYDGSFKDIILESTVSITSETHSAGGLVIDAKSNNETVEFENCVSYANISGHPCNYLIGYSGYEGQANTNYAQGFGFSYIDCEDKGTDS